MTTDKNLLKPEHRIIQAQDVHEIEKEPETDSVEKQNLFPPSLTITVIKRKYPHAFQDKRVTVAKPRIYDDALNGSPGKAYELGDESESLKKHHEDPIVEIPWQHVKVRSQKKDKGEQQ